MYIFFIIYEINRKSNRYKYVIKNISIKIYVFYIDNDKYIVKIFL